MDASQQLQRYTQFVDEKYIASIYQTARSLSGLRVLHFNTTAKGGGVAELLEPLVPLMEELGIKHEREIVQLDERSNRFTTELVDLLQYDKSGALDETEQHALLDRLRHDPLLQNPEKLQADIYCIHDFQLVPLAALFPWMRPAIWFCHVDTAHPNVHAKAYIEQFLDVYRVYTFNAEEEIFPEVSRDKVQIMNPGIDPFSPKNGPLAETDGLELLRQCGIDTTRPLITQVSRFGSWKNPRQVIDIYRQVKRQWPGVQVALVGAMQASDDIQAMEILQDVQGYAGDDPDVHLLHDAAQIQDLQVNAFQRYSNVILQRSTREGFGLTVTEAMWKNQPVVGTTVTGLRRQIVDGQNGYCVDDTDGSADRTLRLLRDRALWKKMGALAHEQVRCNFLFPMMVTSYLNALVKAYK